MLFKFKLYILGLLDVLIFVCVLLCYVFYFGCFFVFFYLSDVFDIKWVLERESFKK